MNALPGLTPSLVDESTMLNGLAVLGYHARLRPADAEPALVRPELCPIDDIFRLLIDLISTYHYSPIL